MNKNKMLVSEVFLGQTKVGYLTHAQDGRNTFTFEQNYIDHGALRPTLSLSFTDLYDENLTLRRLQNSYSTLNALPNFFHNMLPEGGLREFVVQQLKLNSDDEYKIFLALSDDLPGNITLKIQQETASHISTKRDGGENGAHKTSRLKFSLAGVQVKFSMLKKHDRFTTRTNNLAANYIVKTPSILHANLPETEYSMMKMAQAVGVEIPEVELITLEQCNDLPPLNLPDETFAYAIKRFDRTEGGGKVHIEDFAQVLDVRSIRKYSAANYETIAKIIKSNSCRPEYDLEQFIKRLLVNILLGNTDAHLKNWTLYYPDGRKPQLAPAYDIISSLAYIDDKQAALNMAKVKDFYKMDVSVLHRFAKRIDVSTDEIDALLSGILKDAKQSWPTLVQTLPMSSNVRAALEEHWQRLPAPFRILS